MVGEQEQEQQLQSSFANWLNLRKPVKNWRLLMKPTTLLNMFNQLLQAAAASRNTQK